MDAALIETGKKKPKPQEKETTEHQSEKQKDLQETDYGLD